MQYLLRLGTEKNGPLDPISEVFSSSVGTYDDMR